MATKSERAIDEVVGRNVRIHRIRLGYSQEKVGQMLGITFQQVQKFEKGKNRVGAGRLYLIAQHFGVPIESFFDGAGGREKSSGFAASTFLTDKNAIRVASAFSTLHNRQLRAVIAEMVEQIAQHSSPRNR